MPIFTFGDKKPRFADPVWIAPNAVVVGDVSLGRNASIWWNVTVRGDNDPITIGDDTNIQDGSVLHTDEGVPLTIGAGVTIGHMAMLHGCTIEDECLIGIGSIILNGARIGTGSVVAAGALIPEGMQIPPYSMVMGVPGKVKREITPDERARFKVNCQHYVELAAEYKK